MWKKVIYLSFMYKKETDGNVITKQESEEIVYILEFHLLHIYQRFKCLFVSLLSFKDKKVNTLLKSKDFERSKNRNFCFCFEMLKLKIYI